MSAAIDWARGMLAQRGERLLGDAETIRSYPWSTVTRLATDRGDVYLKEVAPAFAVELSLLPVLSEWFPGKVPEFLAIDFVQRRLLMADAGVPLRASLKARFETAPLAAALALCAGIQHGTVERVETLLSLGLADWRLARLPALYRSLLEDVPGLATAEIDGLCALAPRVEALCAHLAACGVPETIEHCDFHDNNVLVRDGRMVIADWGDAVVSHPFLSLASCLDSAGWNHGLTDAASDPLVDAYLSVWAGFGTRERLMEAARLARRLHPILVALNFRRVAAGGAGYAEVMIERLRAFLAAERLTSGPGLGYA